jgi:hypothetical protein
LLLEQCVSHPFTFILFIRIIPDIQPFLPQGMVLLNYNKAYLLNLLSQGKVFFGCFKTATRQNGPKNRLSHLFYYFIPATIDILQ